VSRRLAFALLCVVCVGVAVGYVVVTAVRGDRVAVSGPVDPTGEQAAGQQPLAGSSGTLLVQNLVEGEDWAKVAALPLDDAGGPRSVAPLRCLRMYYAGGRGLCLAAREDFLGTYVAYVFGPDFGPLHEVSLGGIPSRARISPDGRYGATTAFVTGHSYAEAGFSTETLLIELATGATLGNLEEWDVLRDGQPFRAVDFNFWGVTFARDSDRFYATLATGGKTYLVEGSVSARQARVLRENVECPSLSPDGTRLAFKKRVGGGLGGTVWRFHVLDLATMSELALADPRSIDDQIEWLDEGNVLYGVATDLWTVPADGTGEPRKLVRNALSPAVVRASEPAALPPAAAPAQTLDQPAADLAVTLSAAPQTVRAGEEVTYTATVANHGPADATEIVLDDVLPDGTTFGTLSRAQPQGVGYGCPVQAGFLSCTIYSLPAGGTWTISFTVVPSAAGALENRVTVAGGQPDPAPANDTARVRTLVQ
jgi:uncharacterized repeat protein (TIGR01451 family)